MTPAYASPAQRAGKPLSRKTDIWSWVVSVLDMFLGGLSCPNGGHLASEVITEVTTLSEETDSVEIPSDVSEVLRRCFEFAPAGRWASLATVVDVLCEIFANTVGVHYAKIWRGKKDQNDESQASPVHERYGLSPEEWLQYACKLSGTKVGNEQRVAKSARASLIESIRLMDEVIPVRTYPTNVIG